MQTIQKFIDSVSRPSKEAHANHAGAPAFLRSLPEQVLCVLTTGTLSDTFYVKGTELGREALEVLLRARSECPDFLARALVYARNEGFMKTLPVFGLAILSGGRGPCKELFRVIFNQVVVIPDDLRAFVAFSKSGVIPGRKGLGGIALLAVKQWLRTLSEYHAVKYGSSASREISLRDILRLAHPRPMDSAQAERFGWLVKGAEGLTGDSTLNPQIRALESLKAVGTEDEQIALIREGRLPFEVVVPTVSTTTPAIWSALLPHAPYMNLLRSLQTYQRHGVFNDEANVELAVAKLTNERAIARSRVLPFRFYAAWQVCTEAGLDARLTDALRQALEQSFVNLPGFGDQRVCLGTDISSSMQSPVSEKSAVSCVDIAGIFTGALLKRCEERVLVLPFNTAVVKREQFSKRDDIMVTAQKIADLCEGGTAVGAPLEHLLRHREKVDVFIGITDQEEWAYGYEYECSGSFLELWRRYRQEINPEAQAFLVTIAPYRNAVAPMSEPGVRFIYGWSDSVLKYISLSLGAGIGQHRAVEQMLLRSEPSLDGSAEPDVVEGK